MSFFLIISKIPDFSKYNGIEEVRDNNWYCKVMNGR